MNIKKIVSTLHPLEREILPILPKHDNIKEIAKVADIKEVAAERALKWLEKKELVQIKEESEEIVELGKNGKKYLEEGLPEENLLKSLKKKELTINQARKEADLTKEEVNASIGILRKNNLIFITKDKKLRILDKGKKILKEGFPEEKFLKKHFPLKASKIKEQDLLKELKQRKDMLKIKEEKTKSAEITDKGKKILESNVQLTDTIDSLTAEMLKTGSWKEKKFRHFDIKSDVPKIYPGKKQHYRNFLDEVRKKFLSMGFKEMTGPIVETDFWNMDALFMPQFHSARDIHQAYYVEEPKHAEELPKKILSKVKKAHESGLVKKSKGWQYKFDEKRTHRHILRTHDTSISARTLASEDLEIPGKYFQIVRCFRYDVIDATHLPDFNQVGGFVIDDDLNIKHLFDLLKSFAEEFAQTDQIKIIPSYFPFTEPSVELQAKHPKLGWIELAGSGIFRPEMCKALGVDKPVIAWGLGLERLAMFKLGIKDIRELFSHDIEFLRKVKMI